MTRELFFDTDCLSSFLWIDDTNIIEELYGGRMILPEPVYTDLDHPAIRPFHLKERADKLIDKGAAAVQKIEYGTEEYQLYTELTVCKEGKKMRLKRRWLPTKTFSEYIEKYGEE